MRVLQINGVIHQGSTGNIVDAITDYVRSQGDECTIAYGIGSKTSDGNKFCYRFEQAIYRRCSMITGFRYGFAPLATKRLLSFIEKYKPDVVHLHSINGNCVNIFALLTYLKSRTIPTVVTNHAEFFYTGNCTSTYGCTKYIDGCQECPNIKWASDNAFFPKTDYAWKKMRQAFADFKNIHIVCVSEYSLKCSKKSPILSGYNHSVIFNGIDINTFRPLNDIDIRKEYNLTAKKIALFVTPVFSMDKEHLKGGYWLVELSKKYSKDEMQFLVVGNQGADVNQGNIIFAGVIHDRNLLANVYSQVDVVLGFSKSESFGMTCAEALCCGTPFIGFKCGGAESIAIKEFSRFTEYGDLDLMVHYIEEMINTMKERQDYISNIARNYYSDRLMVRSYYDLYKKMCK